jgi:hypothetical protein
VFCFIIHHAIAAGAVAIQRAAGPGVAGVHRVPDRAEQVALSLYVCMYVCMCRERETERENERERESNLVSKTSHFANAVING